MKSKRDYTNKPYNRCLSCPHRKIRCDGPRTSAMELERWCEFMGDMMDINGLNYKDVERLSGVSEKTIIKIMTQKLDGDVMRDTARRIEHAVIGSSNQYPCYLAFEEERPNNDQQMNDAIRELERALEDNKDYKTALDNIHASYNAEMEMIRNDAQKKIDHLLEEVKRAREEGDYWRAESIRKSVIVDKYFALISGESPV